MCFISPASSWSSLRPPMYSARRRLSASERLEALDFMDPVVMASNIRSGGICLIVDSVGACSAGTIPWHDVQLFLKRFTPVLSDNRCADAPRAQNNSRAKGKVDLQPEAVTLILLRLEITHLILSLRWRPSCN